tara:strand:- start:268 stop:1668 length:1401 start_codon:yes stop_codon:yes gene_type:complete
MINKIYKTIHNRFSIFFKFVFFIRYLFVVFFVATYLFLIIPYFFDYKKKEFLISGQLFQSYGLKISQIETIKYKPFPVPHLQLINSSGSLFFNGIDIKISNLKLYPSLSSVYNFSNYQINKIKLNKSRAEIDVNQIHEIIKKLLNLENKIFLSNLVLKVQNDKINLVNLKSINFKNYGFKRNIIDGEIFNRGFKIKFSDKYKNLRFKLLNTGVSAEVDFESLEEGSVKKGKLKSKLLNSNLKLNFIYDKNSLKVNDLFFRDRRLSFDGSGNLKISPFFEIIFNSNIRNLRPEIFSNLDLSKFLSMKDLIKKLNSQININYKERKFSNNLINDVSLKTKLEIGRLSVSKILSIINMNTICKGEVNLLEDFPILDFDCSFVSPDKRKFLKKLDINYKTKNEPFKLSSRGKLNILKNKVNFDYIKINNNESSAEDLKYYKNIFENSFFEKNSLINFNKENIKKFIIEIS